MIRKLCLECGSTALKAVKKVSRGRRLLKIPLKLLRNPASISISIICQECRNELTLSAGSEESLLRRIERLEQYYE